MTADKIWVLVQQGFVDTLYMTIPSTLLAYLVGLPLGVLLVITRKRREIRMTDAQEQRRFLLRRRRKAR